MSRKVIDLTGQRFGRLTVISRTQNTKKGQTRWLCRCDCGNESIVTGANLRNGNTRSCGCLHRAQLVAFGKAAKKHGEYGTRLYRIYRGIITRCTNHNDSRFHYYGKRGIALCPEWRNSFETFRDWALANGYTDKLTIDRIDNNGNYCPENCRWITQAKQTRNTCRNRIINGKTIAEWSELNGIPYKSLWKRLKNNWPLERAITTPLKK